MATPRTRFAIVTIPKFAQSPTHARGIAEVRVGLGTLGSAVRVGVGCASCPAEPRRDSAESAPA